MFCCESFGDKKLIIFVITIYLENCTCGFFIYFNKNIYSFIHFLTSNFVPMNLIQKALNISLEYITNPILVYVNTI